MTFAQMLIEFKARGFNHLGSRAEQYLQDGYLRDIAEEEDWFWLEETKEGPAPLTISDLRAVEQVIDVTNVEKLEPLILPRITDERSVDLTETGTPSVYYITQGTTVNVFPLATNTLQVNYFKVPPELSGEAEPLMPKRWHSLIIDAAVARAYRNSDDYELSSAAKATFEAELQKMRESLLNPQHDAPDDRVVVEDPYALR